MQRKPIDIGMIVRSRAGRDEGRLFLVVGIPEEEYALLCDGSLRKMEAPKRKKRRHITPTGKAIPQAAQLLREGTPPTNAQIRRWLSNEEEM